MKTFTLILLFCFSFTLAGKATDPASNDSLSRQIKTLDQKVSKIDEKVENKYYTRIPNEDFENLISAKIDERVNNKFYFWLGIIITFITLSGAGLYSLIKNQIEIKVKRTSSEFNKYIDESMNTRFTDINNFILEAKKSIFSEELEKLQRRTVNNTSQSFAEYEKIQEKLASLLDRAEEINEPDLSVLIIDELVRCYYLTRNNRKISEIIQKYQDKYDLIVTTLANAAISYTDLYELDDAAYYREMALKYCQECYKKNPVYGEPTTMELLIRMMDHMRVPNNTVKEKARDEALGIIQKINSGSSYYWAYQTIMRLEVDRDIFDKYVDHLYKLFPGEMKEMKSRSDDYETKKHV